MLPLIWLIAAGMFANIPAQAVANTVISFHKKDNALAEKWGNLTLQCQHDSLDPAQAVHIYKSTRQDYNNNDGSLTHIGYCTILWNECITLVNPSDEGYAMEVYESGVELFIPYLLRDTHQKWWHCALGDLGTATPEQEDSLQLTVYTNPSGIKITDGPPYPVDLAMEDGSLTCEMDCTYPSRSVVFYYTESGGDLTRYEPSGDSVPRYSPPCPDSERRYLSTLTLPVGTTFPLGNVDKTVRFKCGVTTFQQRDVLYSDLSPEFRFAVEVSEATLTSVNGYVDPNSEGRVILDGQLQDVFTFQCDPGVSRPPPTIVWYLGEYEQQRGKNSTRLYMTYDLTYDGKVLVCMAFNLQSESDAIISNNLTLITKLQPATIPSNFRVDATAIFHNSVTFLWSPISTSDALVENCVIDYRANHSSPWLTIVLLRNASSVTVNRLKAETVYLFRIYTSNSVGESAKSEVVSVKTSALPDQGAESGGSNIGAVVGGVVGGLTAAVVVIVVVVVITLRRQNKLCFASSLSTTANTAQQGPGKTKPTQGIVDVYYTTSMDADQVPDGSSVAASSVDPADELYYSTVASTSGPHPPIYDDPKVTASAEYLESVKRTRSEEPYENVDQSAAPLLGESGRSGRYENVSKM